MERIIVTLTSYSKRIGNIPAVLDTIFAQTLPPAFVVLNLADNEVIPDKVKEYIVTHPIEVNRMPDTKVFKKLIPTLKKYPNDCIISIDDDFLYPKEMIADFMYVHSLYPNNPISGNKVVFQFWKCHCGCASLTKAEFFDNQLDLIDEELMRNCACDDLVYTYFANRAGHPYLTTSGVYFDNMEPYNPQDSYSATIVGENEGVENWKYLTRRFGDIEQSIIPAYIKEVDPVIVSVIDNIYEKGVGTENYNKGYQQGVSEMQHSFPFRVGKFFLAPFEYLRGLSHSRKNAETGNQLCAIAVPVYKETLDKYEELSFRQCMKILNKYRIILVTPQGLNLSEYHRLADEYGVYLDSVFFSKSFFEGIDGYNRLLKSKEFYSSFMSYQYILIYQLDVFVFRDELEYWCNQGYDYVGAPWITSDEEKPIDIGLWKVGNGGLSLRKISYCMKVLNWKGPVLTYRYYKKIKYLPYILGWKNNISYFRKSNMNEDALFSGFLSPTYLNPHLPTPVKAACFAFEKFPSYLFRMCNNQLPFGCHAFHKYEYEEFWKKYIEEVV